MYIQMHITLSSLFVAFLKFLFLFMYLHIFLARGGGGGWEKGHGSHAMLKTKAGVTSTLRIDNSRQPMISPFSLKLWYLKWYNINVTLSV